MKRIATLLDRETPVRWLFAGDSITHGALHTLGWRDYTELFSERVRWELHRHRDVVIKTGVSGWTIQHLAADLDWSVRQFSPDVVSLMFGMNDCVAGLEGVDAFAATYRTVIATIREQSEALLLLHTPNPALFYADRARAERLLPYRNAILEIARDGSVPLIDHFERWRGGESDGTLQHWLVDGFHPNEYGHRALAQGLFDALGIWKPAESLICQLPIPRLSAS